MINEEIAVISKIVLLSVFFLGAVCGGVISMLVSSLKEQREYENSRAD